MQFCHESMVWYIYDQFFLHEYLLNSGDYSMPYLGFTRKGATWNKNL